MQLSHRDFSPDISARPTPPHHCHLALGGFAWVLLSLTGVVLPQYYDKVFTYSQPAHAHPSFRTERADFFFPLRSCEAVGLRREKSLFLFRRLFGEIAFMLWLVIKGAKPPALDATASSSAAG